MRVLAFCLLSAVLLVANSGNAATIRYDISGFVQEATGTAEPFFTVGDPFLLQVTFDEDGLYYENPWTLWSTSLDSLRLTIPGVDISSELFLQNGLGDIRLVGGSRSSQEDTIHVFADPLFVLSDSIYNRFFMTHSSITINLAASHWSGSATPEIDFGQVTSSTMNIILHDGVGGGTPSFSVALTGFSVTPIPEPSTALLLGLGLTALAVRRGE